MGKKGKKGGKKKKKEKTEGGDELTEVDKAWFEIQIKDLREKFETTRITKNELEKSNETCIREYEKIKEDSADVIAFLKRTLQERADEILELQDRLSGLQQARETEVDSYDKQIAQLKKEFENMKEQLTSENKLLAGKLASLEEFRIQRDDLLAKFEKMQIDLMNQEKVHEEAIYNTEKKFIQDKDKLKKDMVGRITQLAQAFQDSVHVQIASTTHRAVRENIIMAHEVGTISKQAHRLTNENTVLRVRDQDSRITAEILEESQEKLSLQTVTQSRLLNELTEKQHINMDCLDDVERSKCHVIQLNLELDQARSELDATLRQLQEQLQRATAAEEEGRSLRSRLDDAIDHNAKLEDVLQTVAQAIKEVLQLKENAETDIAVTIATREGLLAALLKLLLSEQVPKGARHPTLGHGAYHIGDLGVVPKAEEE